MRIAWMLRMRQAGLRRVRFRMGGERGKIVWKLGGLLSAFCYME